MKQIPPLPARGQSILLPWLEVALLVVLGIAIIVGTVQSIIGALNYHEARQPRIIYKFEYKKEDKDGKDKPEKDNPDLGRNLGYSYRTDRPISEPKLNW